MAGLKGKRNMTADFRFLAKETDVEDGKNLAVTVEGQDLLVASVSGQYYVVRNLCTHAKSTLDGGRQKGYFLFCPLHGVRFDLRDGSTKGKLTRQPLDTFETRVVDGNIEAKLMPLNVE